MSCIVPQEHTPLDWQLRTHQEWLQCLESGQKDNVIVSATGSGKSYWINMAINHLGSQGGKSVLFTNRRALTDQFAKDYEDADVDFGLISASHKKWNKPSAPIQICMSQTIDHRVFRKRNAAVEDGLTPGQAMEKFPLPEADLVIVDEPHMQGGEIMQNILSEYRRQGVPTVGLTATPVELHTMFSGYIKGATNKECRENGRHCWIRCFNPWEMDRDKLDSIIKKVKTGERKTGEYNPKDVVKYMYSQQIYGKFIESHLELNPDLRPAMFFGPDVASSRYAAERYDAKGIRAVCVDGSEISFGGKRYKSTSSLRNEILEEFQDLNNPKRFRVICNRWVFKEAIDIPCLYHVILGVPIRQLHTYIQIAGRCQRSHPSKEYAILQDHGGSVNKLLSPNLERDWEEYFWLKPHHPAKGIENEQRFEEGPQPITCPQCSGIRTRGHQCPFCGFEHKLSVRKILETDGRLREVKGDAVKKARIKRKDDTVELWKSVYHRAKRSKNGMNFNSAYGLFCHEHHYYPPRDLPFMPKNPSDWHRKVKVVDKKRLH